MRSLFEGSAHRLTFGSNGREAVDQARAQRPDLILMDLRMPILDGLQAVAQIRRTPGLELLPIIAVTASSLPEDVNGAGRQFNGYLRKPFSRRELFDELAHFLPRRQEGEAQEQKPETLAPAKSADGATGAARDWARLAAQLRILEEREWPGVRDSLALNESRAFARRLETLARVSGCGALLAYSETLQRHAEACAVASLEEHLQHFPALIARVEREQP
jgi:CheY-like chemotaxis protein